ncbi:MAG: hypothetical protein V3S41_08910, partial [Spirochaetia bacterium]
MILATLYVLAACRTVVPIVADGDAFVEDGAPTPEQAPTATDTALAPAAPEARGVSERQILLIQGAREIIETQSTIVGATTFSYDCTGTILTVYAQAGIYLVDLFGRYTGNGVARLHGIVTAGMNLLKPEIYRNDEGSELNAPMRTAGRRASNP